jgi:hypothetical protein
MKIKNLLLAIAFLLVFPVFSQAASINVANPSAGANLSKDTDFGIVWNYMGLPDSTMVSIELFKGITKVNDIALNVPIKYSMSPSGTGAYKWKVGATMSGSADLGCGYAIHVHVMNSAVKGKSGSFCIVAPPPAGTLKLTSPVGNASWKLGSTQKIAWNCSGYTNQLRIKLYKGSADWGIIAKPNATAGSFDWKVGDMLPPYNINHVFVAGTDYKIYIETLNGEMHDQNAQPFSITTSDFLIQKDFGISKNLADAMADKWIKITAPTANSTLKRMEQYTLVWQYSDFMKKKAVKVLLMKNGQQVAVLIGKYYLVGDHNYIQIESNVPVGDYLVRIQSIDYPDVKVDSGVLHVVASVKTVNYPFNAQTANKVRYHNTWDPDAFRPTPPDFADPGPGNSRVGFRNMCDSGDYKYNYIFRSHIYFNLTGETGAVQSAKISYAETGAPPTPLYWYALTAKWDGDALSLFSIPGTPVNLNDPNQLRDVVKNWLQDPSKNYGLVLVGNDEGMSACNNSGAIHILNQVKLELMLEETE